MKINKQDKYYIKKRKKVTQKSVAVKLGVSEAYISQMINGTKPVPRRFFKQLGKLINKEL
jgi:transcriptional regulator with XRE-family HTH domain